MVYKIQFLFCKKTSLFFRTYFLMNVLVANTLEMIAQAKFKLTTKDMKIN